MRSIPSGDPGPKSVQGTKSSLLESLSGAGSSGAAAGPHTNNKISEMKRYREHYKVVALGGQNLPGGLPCSPVVPREVFPPILLSSSRLHPLAAGSSPGPIPPLQPYPCPIGTTDDDVSTIKPCSTGKGGSGTGSGPGGNIQSMCFCYYNPNYYSGPDGLPGDPARRTGRRPCLPCEGSYLASSGASATGRS